MGGPCCHKRFKIAVSGFPGHHLIQVKFAFSNAKEVIKELLHGGHINRGDIMFLIAIIKIALSK